MYSSMGTIKEGSLGTMSEKAPDWVVDLARNTPTETVTAFRVVVLEGDGRRRVSEFQALEEALQYADDVASESDVPWATAYVFAPGPQFVRRGHHYAAP
jgi:hypothetical protein